MEEEDIFSIFCNVPPGLVVCETVTEGTKYLVVHDFNMPALNLSSVGFELDGEDSNGEFGPPTFFHNKMEIRHCGTPMEFIHRGDVQEFLERHSELIRQECGVLPLLKTFDQCHGKDMSIANEARVLASAYAEHHALLRKVQEEKAT